MKYTTEIEIRFSDIDAYGHVNSAVYFTYLETARVKFFKDYFIELMSKSLQIFVVKAECEYRKPINLSDKVFITLGVDNIGNTSFTLIYDVHDDKGNIFATGKTTMVSFDANKKKAVTIPNDFLKVLRQS